MYVASTDRSNPNLNAVYEIGPNAQLIAVFTQFTAGQTGVKFNINPSSILVMPPQDQSFLRGLFTGSGSGTSTTAPPTFSALFFNANGYSPGTPISSTTLPTGVTQTNLALGPQVGLTDANNEYASPVYSAYTDFGTPAGPGHRSGAGLQRRAGHRRGRAVDRAAGDHNHHHRADARPDARRDHAVPPVRRHRVRPVWLLLARAPPDHHDDQRRHHVGDRLPRVRRQPVRRRPGDRPRGDGDAPRTASARRRSRSRSRDQGPVGVTTDAAGNVIPLVTNGNTTGGSNIGGRILRITPNGQVTVFADNFDTSGAQDSTSFIDSSLSISFSADGTVLYASDDQGIWQFKTTADLADSTSGSLVGLNDLRNARRPL